MMRKTNQTIDLRLGLWRLNFGLRIRTLDWRWYRYKPFKWQWNPWFGPIELNVYWSRVPQRLLSASASIDFERKGRLRSYRFHPIGSWRRKSDEIVDEPWTWSRCRWWGPFWFYERRPPRPESERRKDAIIDGMNRLRAMGDVW